MRYICILREVCFYLHAMAAAIVCSFMSGHEACASDFTPDSASVGFREKVCFHRAPSHIDSDYADNRTRLETIREFLQKNRSGKNNTVRFVINGAASPEGDTPYNENLAFDRASSLMSHFGIYNISLRGDVITESDKRNWPSCRYAELSAYAGTSRLAPDCQAKTVATAETASAVCDTTGSGCSRSEKECPGAGKHSNGMTTGLSTHMTVDSDTDTEETESKTFRLIAGTNMLYDAALVPNIGIGVMLGDKVSLWADWMYAWWSNRDKRRYWRIYGGDFEARWHFGHGRSANPLSGHRLGIYASILTYDIQFGRSHTGIMGDKFNYAAGISYGYSLPVARRLNIDFALGIGYMWGRYMKQRLIDTHDVWQSTHNRRWFGPTKAEISLVWLIGPGNVNETRRKGGDR
ncbi:MAG: DUF3575 domain-containing protein [Muribaculaceae bacterium]|nr:DUF3575 domain-containing protein [Muribaculaceae bacterium]